MENKINISGHEEMLLDSSSLQVVKVMKQHQELLQVLKRVEIHSARWWNHSQTMVACRINPQLHP
jgi:hypothetical protein